MDVVKLSSLPYPPGALEPILSSQTIDFHYGKHHKGYVDRLNELLKSHGGEYDQKLRTQRPWGDFRKLLRWLVDQPQEIVKNRAANNDLATLQFNAYQHFLHATFWMSMTPEKTSPSRQLARSLEADLGGIPTLERVFQKTAAEYPWSGWLFLVLDPDKRLNILHTEFEFPVQEGVVPLLTCDLWEHAYYLDYQSDRARWVENFFQVANWDMASRLYDDEMRDDDDGE